LHEVLHKTRTRASSCISWCWVSLSVVCLDMYKRKSHEFVPKQSII
jgi:hypothetical protein